MMLFQPEKHSHSCFILLIPTHITSSRNSSMVSSSFTSPPTTHTAPWVHTTYVSAYHSIYASCLLSISPLHFAHLYSCISLGTSSSQWIILAVLWLTFTSRPRDVISVTQGHTSLVIWRTWNKIQTSVSKPWALSKVLYYFQWPLSRSHFIGIQQRSLLKSTKGGKKNGHNNYTDVKSLKILACIQTDRKLLCLPAPSF